MSTPCPISFLGGVSPPTTIPGMKSQTYLIEFSLWGKLYRLTDSPVWSLFVSSLPVRFQTILKWFRKRLFLLFFFGTRLWQSVTMLIGDKLSNQKELKSRDLLPSRSGVVREWVIICASIKSLVITGPFVIRIGNTEVTDWLIYWFIDWLIDCLIEWFIF